MNTHVTHFVYKESRGSRPRCRTRGVSVAASPAFSLILASVLGLVVPARAIAQQLVCAGLVPTPRGAPSTECLPSRAKAPPGMTRLTGPLLAM